MDHIYNYGSAWRWAWFKQLRDGKLSVSHILQLLEYEGVPEPAVPITPFNPNYAEIVSPGLEVLRS